MRNEPSKTVLVLAGELSRAGGLEKSLSHKVAAWTKRGVEVQVVSVIDNGPDFYPVGPRVSRRSLGIRYRQDEPLHSAGNLWRALQHALALWRLLRAESPDVVIHCGYGFDFFLLPLLAPKRTILIKENHSSRAYSRGKMGGLLMRMKSKLRTRFERRYTWMVFLSEEEARACALPNARVIPNALPPLAYDPEAVERKNVVIAAGRICHVKGFDRLLEVWALASPRLAGWELHMYGDGEPADVAELGAKIDQAGISSTVRIRPATPIIGKKMAESRLYAMTSRSECFPMVLLEATQIGLPIISFDCPTGPRNIVIDTKTGRLIPDGDTALFADTLVALALDPAACRRMSEQARIACRRFEIDQVTSDWMRLFGVSP